MIRIIGNMWEIAHKYPIVCITTNGFVKTNGEAVMGRGNALEAKTMYPDLPAILGKKIHLHGNIVQGLKVIYPKVVLTAFPVKHNWWEEADIELIKQSCHQLIDILDKNNIKTALLPMPGVGNGKLDFDFVEATIGEILDDRVHVITRS